MVTLRIIDHHKKGKGVIFFRYVRLLEAFYSELVSRGISCCYVHGNRLPEENEKALQDFRSNRDQILLITRDTGKRGLDLPEADYALFYSPKARDDVTWQEVSRIRSTIVNKKHSHILNYSKTAESNKADRMFDLFREQPRSIKIRRKLFQSKIKPKPQRVAIVRA